MMKQQHSLHIPRPSLKQVLLAAVGSALGVFGLLVTVALYIVAVLTHPKRRTTRDLYALSPYEFDLPAEAVRFPPRQGDYSVAGWYIPSPDATTTILVCPGYRSRAADVLGICAHLWKAGHNVLVFEYYGHGMPVGTAVTLGYCEVNDFLGAVTYVKARAPQTSLGVLAYSMGAAVAIMCSAWQTEVEALVADSAFASHRSVIDYHLHRVFHLPLVPLLWLADALLWRRAGYHFRQVEPLRDIAAISPRPVLIIHGLHDSVVDPRDAQRLYTAAREPKELWLIPNADHCGAYFADRPAYVAKIETFFHRSLVRESQRSAS